MNDEFDYEEEGMSKKDMELMNELLRDVKEEDLDFNFEKDISKISEEEIYEENNEQEEFVSEESEQTKEIVLEESEQRKEIVSEGSEQIEELSLIDNLKYKQLEFSF